MPPAAQPSAAPSRGPKQRPEDPFPTLVRNRLGVYTGLFLALRAKHPPTAEHSLRVAMLCSTWARWRNLDDPERSLLEVAALFHDIGKLGIPDHILQKRSELDRTESLVMDMQSDVAEEILRGAEATPDLLAILKRVHLPPDLRLRSPHPLSDMLVIADAWDAMTTDQVFRAALSRERAIEELFQHAGTQFALDLVEDFVRMLSAPHADRDGELATRWLGKLTTKLPSGFQHQSGMATSGAIRNFVDNLFHHRMLEVLPIAAMYLDATGQIILWNRAAEQMFGRSAVAVLHQTWAPELLGLQTTDGSPLTEADCPVAAVQKNYSDATCNVKIARPNGGVVLATLEVHPVLHGRELAGMILVATDQSDRLNLQAKVESLHEMVTKDGLTKVANRAELDRRLPSFVEEHLQGGYRGSIIICDIDFFKRINDNYGHQAGDEALKVFANILRSSARSADLVARYGGEEFVILCPQCDIATATARAEEIRRKVEQVEVSALDGASMTSSFGVTEIQPGDDPETLIARADRALITAKENGRNRVVQLGVGQSENGEQAPFSNAHIKEDLAEIDSRSSWLRFFRRQAVPLMSAEYLTAVPEQVALEKVMGFIEDHQGELISSAASRLGVRIDGRRSATVFRRHERPPTLLLDITLTEVRFQVENHGTVYQRRTKVTVLVRSESSRDRRKDTIRGQAMRVLQSFQAYLVAQPIDDALRKRIIEPRG
ncbi:MAG: diguanylate cyclase [Pirellulaceae bacterium]|nr:MAG: diguanylate cyclase [Pirellulaceae bacterium]